MGISIIHPSRSRPQRSYETIQKWMNSAVLVSRLEIIISLDSDDPYIQDYLNLYKGQFIISVANNRSSVEAINTGAKKSIGDILMVVSDDTDPINFWDERIILETLDKTDWILKTKDGIQEWIITFPIMHRAYYNRTGYIYHPDFEHMFCDTWMSVMADVTGRRITSKLLFPHLNDSIKDDVRTKTDATWAQGEKTFINLCKSLPKEDIRKITDQSMINWLRNKGVR